MKNKFLWFFLFSLFSFAETPLVDRNSLLETTAREKLPSVLENLLADLDGQYVWRNFNVEPIIKKCKSDKLKIELPGVKSHIIEPMMIGEVTREYMRLEFLQLDLAGKFDFAKTGKVNENEGAAYVHVFKFPILGRILKKASDGMICLEQGSISVLTLSEFDPSSWNSILRLQVLPTLKLFLTPEAAFYGITSCVSGTALNHIPSRDRFGKSGKILRDIIDINFYNVGCNGMKTVGAHTSTENPFSSALTVIMAQIDMISSDTYFLPQTVVSSLNGWSEDIYCKPNVGLLPMINTQYQSQLLRPRRGKPFITASTPAEWSSFKNDGTTQGNSVFFIWQERDFSMGVYACSKSKD